MADGVTLSILNLVRVSCYDRLYDVRHCHAVDTPEDNKPWSFLWVAGLSWFQGMTLYLTLFINLSYHKLSESFIYQAKLCTSYENYHKLFHIM